MPDRYLTIKELTEAVGGDLTPRMVRHYHASRLLPPPRRSKSNYRLYTHQDVQRLQRIVALKAQGFQLSHIRKLLETETEVVQTDTLTPALQQQYQSVIQQLARLRRTASALEGLLGRDRHCQDIQAEAIAQLRHLEVEGLDILEKLWDSWDAATDEHPEAFTESLQQLLPDLSNRSEIEVDLLSKLVLACGDVSLVQFVRISQGSLNAIATARDSLKSGCQIVGDVPAVVGALDQTRLAHLKCSIETLIADPHITSAVDAETSFWYHYRSQNQWQQLEKNCILVVGYAPSVLLSAIAAINHGELQPALVIGMPIGFSHAPAAKRRLIRSGVPFITIDGTFGGGLLAAITLNALAESLIEKPDCHCYLG